jgi:hypothetical protein
MKKSVRFAGILAGALAFASLLGVSANADTRPQDESSWRQSRGDDRYDRDGRRDSRRDDRDFLSGRVERVDQRRNVVLLRGENGRTIVVQMVRNRNHRGIDVDDLRRGDYVTFAGDWSRRGFQALRIEDVDRGRRGRDRDRW